MASTNTLCKNIINVKNAVVTDTKFYEDQDGVNHVRISIGSNKWHENDCPYCHKRCVPYDRQIDHPRSWRRLDWGGTFIDMVGYIHRIKCPVHGVVIADVPGHIREADLPKSLILLSAGWLAVCHGVRCWNTCASIGKQLAVVCIEPLTR